MSPSSKGKESLPFLLVYRHIGNVQIRRAYGNTHNQTPPRPVLYRPPLESSVEIFIRFDAARLHWIHTYLGHRSVAGSGNGRENPRPHSIEAHDFSRGKYKILGVSDNSGRPFLF